MILTPDHRPPRWPIVTIIIALILFVTMGPLLSADFTNWDDDSTVSLNSRFNPPTLAGTAHFWTHSAGSLYIPVTYTVWAGLASVARLSTPGPGGVMLNPFVFHAANLVLHLFSTLLVFSIAYRLTKRGGAAFVGAMLFALHPVQVESVGWVSGMKDLLWGFFALAAIDQYIAAVTNDRPKPRYALATICFVLAMLSKPTAMVTPIIAFVIDYLLLRRNLKAAARFVVPWLLLAIPCMIWTRLIQPGAAQDGGPIWARPLIVLDSLNFYLGKLVWPATLTPDYGHRPEFVIASGHLAWTWIAPVVLIVLAIWQFKKRPYLAAGGLVFIAGCLPMLGLIPFSFQFFSTTADHYLYVSMLGLAIVTACVLTEHPRWRLIVTLALALFGIRSWLQTGVWTDGPTLYTHMLTTNPRSFAAANLISQHELTAGRPQSAEAYLRHAIELEPKYPLAHNNLATLLVNQNRFDEALPHIRVYVAAAGNVTPALLAVLPDPNAALGVHYLNRQQNKLAAEQFREALKKQPDNKSLQSLLKKSQKTD